jgi:hypothetical protein
MERLTLPPGGRVRIRSLSAFDVWEPRTGLCAFTVGAAVTSAFDRH